MWVIRSKNGSGYVGGRAVWSKRSVPVKWESLNMALGSLNSLSKVYKKLCVEWHSELSNKHYCSLLVSNNHVRFEGENHG